MVIHKNQPSAKHLFTGGKSVLELPFTISFMEPGTYEVCIKESRVVVTKKTELKERPFLPYAHHVEVGILMTDKSNEDYNHYAQAWDHQYGYYDEDAYFVQDKDDAIKQVKEYVEAGVDMTYGVITESLLSDSCFDENMKLHENVVPTAQEYDPETIVYCVAKIGGELVEGFVKNFEKHL